MWGLFWEQQDKEAFRYKQEFKPLPGVVQLFEVMNKEVAGEQKNGRWEACLPFKRGDRRLQQT
jgi:hypothetical protein